MPTSAVEILLNAKYNAQGAVQKARQELTEAGQAAARQFDAASVAADKFNANVIRTMKQHRDFTRQMAVDYVMAMDEMGAAAEYSASKARMGFMEVDTLLGVKMPRALTSFLAGLEGIGPMMASAFSAVAVIGLVDVIATQLPAAYTKLEGAITGWNEKAKQEYDKFIDQNHKAIVAVLDLQMAKNKALGIDGANVPLTAKTLGEATSQKVAFEKERDAIPSESTKSALERRRDWRSKSGAVLANEADQPHRPVAEIDKDIANTQKLIDELRGKADEAKKEAAVAEINKSKEDAKLAVENAKKKEEAQERLAESTEHTVATTREQQKKREEEEKEAAKEQARIEKEADDAKERLLESTEHTVATTRELQKKSAEEQARADKDAQEAQERLLESTEHTVSVVREFQKRSADEAKKKADDVIKSFRDGAGKMWDDFFLKGKGAFGDLVNAAKGLLQSITKTLFQDLTTGLLFGSGASGSKAGGGLLGGLLNVGGSGLLSKIPGIGGILGKAGGGILGGVLGAGTAVAGTVATGAGTAGVAGGIIMGTSTGGVVGAGAGAGAGGLAGLGALMTNPWTIGIAAGILGGIGLYKLFHHPHAAPFTRDPNEVERNRSIFFFTGMTDAMNKFSNSVDGFTNRVASIQPGDLITAALPTALASSNQLRRNVAGTLLNDDV